MSGSNQGSGRRLAAVGPIRHLSAATSLQSNQDSETGTDCPLASVSVPTSWDGWDRPPVCEGRNEIIRAAWRQPGACPPKPWRRGAGRSLRSTPRLSQSYPPLVGLRRSFAGLRLLALMLFISCGTVPPRAADTEPWFIEVSEQLGIQFQHVRAAEQRYWLPEIMSGGAAWLDYDDDGDLDLYLVQGGDLREETGLANRLYRNDGTAGFVDVTDQAGVGDQGYGMGCAVGDYDGDGDVDLYVTNVGPDVLYRNEADGTFSERTAEAGVGDPGWGTSAAFLDYDRDGRLDLFVTRYVNWSDQRELECYSGGRRRDYCLPNYQSPATDILYHNDGDGSFSDVTAASGLAQSKGSGLGVASADFDGDGWIDIYVANDGDPNQLWINGGDGSFRDQALLSGNAVNRHGMAEAGMGVAVGDVGDDGDFDLLITHLRNQSNTLYVNQDGYFDDLTAVSGLSAPSLAYTGFGAGFADFDLDGELDLYVANGRVVLGESDSQETDSFAESNLLFRGIGGGRFQEARPRGGVEPEVPDTSRAAAFANYDNDGDIDVLVVNNQGKARLLSNLSSARQGNWIGFSLEDEIGNEAPGALVRVTAGDRNWWRLSHRAYSYLASNDPRIHVGLGEAPEVDEVEVRWPDGTVESYGRFPAGRIHRLRKSPPTSEPGPPE